MPEFDGKIFGELLKEAKGDRSINNYALHSGVDASHISRFIRGLVKNPPSPNTIKKLSEHAHNDVTYEKLMEAAGHIVYHQQYLFENDENEAPNSNNEDTQFYQFLLNSSKKQIRGNHSYDNKSAVLIAFNAFEIMLNEVLIKGFINKTGLEEDKAFNFINSLTLKSKVEMHLQMYVDFDITKEEYYKELVKYMEIRDKILHGTYKSPMLYRHVNMIFDVIESSIKSINQYAQGKDIE
ncbi:hypothetical protein [Rossellomorea sp. NPDC077527]|uniref:hypothetical protein n=1 Tax=Rossellomorea sp. NPDC077527 TaxID=3364510 RepID=UPI0037C79A48